MAGYLWEPSFPSDQLSYNNLVVQQSEQYHRNPTSLQHPTLVSPATSEGGVNLPEAKHLGFQHQFQHHAKLLDQHHHHKHQQHQHKVLESQHKHLDQQKLLEPQQKIIEPQQKLLETSTKLASNSTKYPQTSNNTTQSPTKPTTTTTFILQKSTEIPPNSWILPKNVAEICCSSCVICNCKVQQKDPTTRRDIYNDFCSSTSFVKLHDLIVNLMRDRNNK